MPHSFPDPGTLHKLWGGQSCPQPAFSRLWPPKKAAAAKIGRPTICTASPTLGKLCGMVEACPTMAMNTLVIGYGTSLRGDDGAGPFVARQLGAGALACPQLTPE